MTGKRKAIVSLIAVTCVIAACVAIAGHMQILNLAAFTYFYSGLNIFAQPNFAIPRLPPAENFELVDHVGGAPGAMTVAGRFAYVAFGSEFLVIDTVDPSRPQVVGSLTLLSCIKGICVNGTTAYVADGRGGLRILDVSEPTNPKEQSTFGHHAAVQAVATKGDFAYTAAGIDGLQVLDCSNRSRPRLSGFRDSIPGQYGPDSTAIVALDNSLCVVDGSSGLRLMDIEDAGRPRLLDSIQRQGSSECALAGEDSTVVIAGTAGGEGVWIYDLSDAKIRLRANVKVPSGWWANGAVMRDRHAYVATSNGLLIIDLRDPGKPVTVCAWSSAPLSEVAVQDNTGFLCTTAGDFLVVDLTRKSKPTIVCTLHLPGRVLSSCISDNLLLTGSSGKLLGFAADANGVAQQEPSISIPANYARYLACSKRLLAVLSEINNDPSGCREWLELWDLSAQSKPGELCKVSVPKSNVRPVFTNSAVTTGGYTGIYTVGLPANKAHPKVTFLSIKHGIRALCAHKDFLYVAKDNEGGPDAVEVYDATDPEHLRSIGSTTLGDSIDGLCCEGKYLYATSGKFLGKNSLMIFDISSPSNIKLVSSLELFGGTAVEIDDNIAFVEEISRIAAIDVSDPQHPKRVGSIDTVAVPMSVVDLSVHKGLCCLAAEQAGLYVYRLERTESQRATRHAH